MPSGKLHEGQTGTDLVTYALLDLIDTRAGLLDGSAAKRLAALWRSADVWTNNCPLGSMEVEPGRLSPIDVYVTSFSDSLLLRCEPEIPIIGFYSVVRSLMEAVRSHAGELYAIISRGEMAVHVGPSLGGHAIGRTGQRKFSHVAGLGPAWMDLYLAEMKVKSLQEWHGAYWLYGVGERSKPPGWTARDQRSFPSRAGEKVIYAFE